MGTKNIFYTSREQIEVYRFSVPVVIAAPVLAILFQTFISGRFAALAIFDLPLLITIFFSVARRNPVIGLLQGGAIGLVQDAFTKFYLGVYGIPKTLIGFLASSIGGKVDVDNPGSRLLMTMGFYIVHQLVLFAITRAMLGEQLALHWSRLLLGAVLNGALAVILFSALDRFRQRT